MINVSNNTYTWQTFELEFESMGVYTNPYMELELNVEFISPAGKKNVVPGFWDGDNKWKVRFAPPVPGCWKWETKGDNEDFGFNDKSGQFFVEEYKGDNPIYKHGFLKISENKRGFCYSDGTPFFWLGDTLWSCPSRATTEEWKEIVAYRCQQGFNIAQVNILPQHDCSGENDYRLPFDTGNELWNMEKLNTSYFQALDEQMKVTAETGLFTAMVVLWFDYVPGTNPTWQVHRKAEFTPELAAHYGRYIAARYGAFGTCWLVTGDSDFENSAAISIYDSAANAIREALPYKPLMTAHLNGGLCTPENLEQKQWLDFHMYQSSHNKTSELVAKKYSMELRSKETAKPILNGEPIYEGIGFHMEKESADRSFVRKTGWYSILSGGNAGITYGAHGMWGHHRQGEAFLHSEAWHMPLDWKFAIRFEGAEDYGRMKSFFESLPWLELEPSNEILDGDKEEHYIAAATKDQKLIVVYAKDCSCFDINLSGSFEYDASWFDPASGEKLKAETLNINRSLNVKEVPWKGEAVLLLKAKL